MQGRVAVLQEYGGDFELREYPVPDVEPGAILVKLTRAGICGSDLHIWRGEMKDVYGQQPRDLTFGHEMCGHVVRLGAGVSTDSMGQPLKEGDGITYASSPAAAAPSVCRMSWAVVLVRGVRIASQEARHISTMRTAIIIISGRIITCSRFPTTSPTIWRRQSIVRSHKCSMDYIGLGSVLGSP